jgi:serine/threonine protein kinase
MDKTLSRFKEKTILKTLYSRERSLEKLTLNSFTFLKCLGKGVSCSVYLARNKITGKIYAIKQI